MESRVVITGGGSGGHVFPTLAVAEHLIAQGVSCVWLGSTKGIERGLVRRWGLPFFSFPAGKLRRYLSLQNLADVFITLAGILRCISLLRKIRPRLVFSKGGFVSVPVVLAAGLLKIPVYSHESDVDPGLATRINSRIARSTFVAYQESLRYYPKNKALVTGNPVRKEMLEGNPEAGLRFVGFRKDDPRPVLLVLGGSLGARSVNALVDQLLPRLLPKLRIIHQRGRQVSDETLAPVPSPGEYAPFNFIGKEFADVLACADFVLSRSGAGSLWELGLKKKPAVFIPLVEGARGDQLHNAKLCEQHGAAQVWQSGKDNVEDLGITLLELAENEQKRRSMASCWEGIVHADAAKRIADLLISALSRQV